MTHSYGAVVTFLIDWGEIDMFRRKPAKVALSPNHKAHMEHNGNKPGPLRGEAGDQQTEIWHGL
jgi:hypothetical protein